jgi:hypothetical protein
MNWHDADHRSSAPQAYLNPVESARTNWLTLVTHLVCRFEPFNNLQLLISNIIPYLGYEDQVGQLGHPADRLRCRIRPCKW